MEVIDLLKKVPEFENVPAEQLKWMMDKSDCLTIKKGDYLFEPGSAIDKLLIVLDGSFTIKMPRKNQFQTVGTFEAPVISGMLPYSRADKARAFAEAKKESCVVSLHQSFFGDMIKECHELTTALVHTMSSRIRQFTKLEQQDDKMMALGKLSAGLAHELNNPSAAVVRSSKELSKHLKFLPDKFKAVIKIDMEDEDVDRVNNLLFDKINGGLREIKMMERSEKEDEMIEWLEKRKIDDPEELTDNFIDYGFEIKDLEVIGQTTPKWDYGAVFGWINQVMTTERLVGEIEDASQRINDLVLSVKSYTHMDQAPAKTETDLHVGISNTLTMLNHKLKDNRIEVQKEFDEQLPQPEVMPNAINQVWTNLIDNAIDAMEERESRVLTISTVKDGDFVKVKISDTGSGIPDDIRDKIFDPFFTTKPIGKGTGLGLENVQQIVKVQHNGTIDIKSKSGHTVFTVCLPIKAA
ncbi:ATP-binding protein [Ekhidna sp.]